MNSIKNTIDDVVECPLCMEPLEVDDLNFFPCTCGYQICRFCWHRIRTDENELCPACRKEYPENPADFKPLTQEEMIAFKSQKKQRDQQRKQKITENRKHLANVRVVQKNLVFVVGLPPRLADADILKKHEYFGKYGKIHKVVINPSTTYAGIQGPSASAYVTYVQNTDALRAIQSVNNIMIDGRLIKTSLGTTKYCSHFMKNQQCPKADCMYLHELGDADASFTKEEMHQGKHQEYEKRLHDTLIASSGTTTNGCTVSPGNSNSLCVSKNSESCKITGILSTTLTGGLVSSSSVTVNNSAVNSNSAPQKEAWPSLSVSPVNQKDCSSNNLNKNKKERTKQDKAKNEKNFKTKNNKTNIKLSSVSLTKDVDLPIIISNTTVERSKSNTNSAIEETAKLKLDKSNEKNQVSFKIRLNQANELATSTIEKNDKKDFDSNPKAQSSSFVNLNTENDNNINKIGSQCSISSSIFTESINNSVKSECVSGKSFQGSYNENDHDGNTKTNERPMTESEINLDLDTSKENTSDKYCDSYRYVNDLFLQNQNTDKHSQHINKVENKLCLDKSVDINRLEDKMYNKPLFKDNPEDDTLTDNISKLNLIDENSFFSTTTGIQQQAMKLKRNEEIISNQFSNGTAPNLPDLINGIDGYQNITSDFQASFTNYLTGSDLRRQSSYIQYQQQSNESSNDNTLQHSMFGTNMSKFFDFHKHQQQQKLQQQCLQINSPNKMNGDFNENFNMMPLIENSFINSQLVDKNCILTTQQHHQKSKLYGKMDQVLCHQTLQQLPKQQIGPVQSKQTPFVHNITGDDDLGFDPFIETQKALAELIETEEQQQNVATSSSKLISRKHGNNLHQPHQQHMMECMQRTRMPPPGFNNVNFNEYNVSRINNSKVMPFMNMPNNYTHSTGQPIQHQQLQISNNAWGTHLGNFQQHINENQHIHQVSSNQIQSGGNVKACAAGNDWTAMDPAILSFRQFSFPHQTQVPPQMQPQQQEIFLQQLTLQQQQAGFSSQSLHVSGGNAGIPNTIINSQQSSQPHVNANVQGMLEYLKTRQFV